MTNLPTRTELAGVGATYGQVRNALGNLRDFLGESLGTSGTSPVLSGAVISGAESLGVRVGTPGATAQIAGSLAVTAATATSDNPGDGNILVDGLVRLGATLGTKLEFSAPTGAPLAIGTQTNSLYARVKPGGTFAVFEGGTHSSTAGSPGAGGAALLVVSPSVLTYKGQTVYHAGNGVFIRKDAPDTASEKITFTKGLDSAAPVTLNSSKVNFTGAEGNRLSLSETLGVEAAVVGTQTNTMFVRTPENFTVYKGGTWAPTEKTPGEGGAQLFNVSSTELKYKNFDVYHSGNATFVNQQSTNRPGVTELWRSDADVAEYIFAHWNHSGDSRFRLRSSTGAGVRVDHATTSDTASTATFLQGTTRTLMAEQSTTRRGTTRIYLANQDTNHYVDPAFDGGRFLLRGINGTNGAHQFEVRVQYADTAGAVVNVNGNNIIDGTVRYHELARGQSSATFRSNVAGQTSITVIGINQFSFSGFNIAGGADSPTFGYLSGGRLLRLISGGGQGTITWDYVTGSGDPRVWVVYDDMGNITGAWDGEDPFDRDKPDNPVFYTLEKEEFLPLSNCALIDLPHYKTFESACDRLIDTPLPAWVELSRVAAEDPQGVIENIMLEYTKGRVGMQDYAKVDTWDEFIWGLDDSPKKIEWRNQAILRAYARLFGASPLVETGAILGTLFKYNKKSNALELR